MLPDLALTLFGPSPFFNIFTPVSIGLLKENEAIDLIKKPSKGVFNDNDVNFILDTAGYYPFFMQVACYHTFKYKSDKKVQVLDESEYDTIKNRILEGIKPHFDYLLHPLTEDEKMMLQLYCSDMEIYDMILKLKNKYGTIINIMYELSEKLKKCGYLKENHEVFS